MRKIHRQHTESPWLPPHRVQKAKPLKKIKETYTIPSTKFRTGFGNLEEVNRASDNGEDSLLISIDTKAKVDLWDSSHGGTSRCKKAAQADDHDLEDTSKLIPFGILEVMTGLLMTLFGVSFETSDFIVDGIEHWWNAIKTSVSISGSWLSTWMTSRITPASGLSL
ncbi:MAG: hypothetical protein WC856_04340 [Methylococcaceae bacterium]